MANDKGRDGISARTLYSLVAQMYASLFLVQVTAGRPEGDWARGFVMIYLVAMTVLFAVARFLPPRGTETRKGPEV